MGEFRGWMKGDHSKSWCLCLCYSFPPYLTKVRDHVHAFLYFLVMCTAKKSQPSTNLFKIIPGSSLTFPTHKRSTWLSRKISPVRNQVIQPQAVTLSLIHTATAEFIFPSFWPCVKQGLFSWLWVYLRSTHCKSSFSKGVLLF